MKPTPLIPMLILALIGMASACSAGKPTNSDLCFKVAHSGKGREQLVEIVFSALGGKDKIILDRSSPSSVVYVDVEHRRPAAVILFGPQEFGEIVALFKSQETVRAGLILELGRRKSVFVAERCENVDGLVPPVVYGSSAY